MPIGIVTDSACDLPPEIVAEHRITVIPLHIHLGGQSYLDGVDLSREAFYQRLREPGPLPTTAVPGPDAFVQTYQQLADQGVTEILSIHISRSLSSIVDVALLAAREIRSVLVTVFDSGQLSLGTGFLVWAAAQAAGRGRSMGEIVESLQKQAARTYVFAALDTLEFLRRSGRMNLALASLGSLLRIKPLLKMHAGSPTSERVRTRGRAIARLIELVSRLGPLEKLALVHTHNPEGAEALGELAQHLFPTHGRPLSVEVTPVIGTHIGPGAVGFACVSASAEETISRGKERSI